MSPVFQAVEEQILDDGDHLVVGKWYFWDEAWAYAHGPYDTEDAADTACADYARSL